MILNRKLQEPTQPSANLPFELRFEGTFDGIRDALTAVMVRLQPLHLSDDARGIVELVLAETFNNIAEHGFADLPRPGFISVLCAERGSDLVFRITDFGKPMPDHRMPDPTIRPDAPKVQKDAIASLPEGGFGWALIHDLTRDVTYQRCGPMNALTLSVPVKNR